MAGESETNEPFSPVPVTDRCELFVAGQATPNVAHVRRSSACGRSSEAGMHLHHCCSNARGLTHTGCAT
eukprot:5195720-Prymnesium_polylepis.2